MSRQIARAKQLQEILYGSQKKSKKVGDIEIRYDEDIRRKKSKNDKTGDEYADFEEL